MSLNKVIMTGRLTRDPELVTTSGGFSIAKMSIAVDNNKKKGDEWVKETLFFNVEAFGKIAENCDKFLTKGYLIGVDGKGIIDKWEDKETGKMREKFKIAAATIDFMQKPRGAEGNSEGGSTKDPWKGNKKSESSFAAGNNEEDIPF